MKSTVENLKAILEHMTALYAKLLKQAEAKREAIIAGDITALEKILEEEYRLLEKVNKAEEMRSMLSEKLEDECGVARSKRPVKLKSLIALLGAKGKELYDVQNKIKHVLEKFRFRNRQNEELLKASIAHVDEFMNMIKGRAGRNNTYDKSGHNSGGGLSILDRRA